MEEMNNDFQEPQYETSSTAESDNFAKEAVSIQHLVQSGLLNPQQGQYYMSQLAQKTLNRLTQDEETQPAPSVNTAFDDFILERPDFFKPDGRSDVLNYLKDSNVDMDKDEIRMISDMVEKIEKCAIERYIQQQSHEQALNNENEAAKRKLTANAQNSSFSANKNRAFTREQIGKMSSAEFTKYEPLIMEQLKKGQIK